MCVDWTFIWATVIGAVGGVVFGLSDERNRSLKLPFSNQIVETGFLGDMFTGATAAIAVLFIGPAVGVERSAELSQIDKYRIFGLCAIAGLQVARC